MTCKIKQRKKIVCLEDDLPSVTSKSSSSEVSIGENEIENIWNHRGFKKLTKGHIVFQNVSLEYDNYTQILNNVSFEILPGEKVGVVGQKNADSNSVAIALYRLRNICNGVIMIDDMDLSSIDIVGDIFIVQKDPIIYSNTIRGIVDLSNKFSDADIWNALEKVRLKYLMDKKKIDLDTKVNLMRLSSVKRQLLFLVQALIKKPKILIVKENEESQDPEQMNVLQEIILEQFERETVLILANHPKSISSCDKILYLDKGEVVEEGKPSVLLKSPSSRLSRLIFNLKDIIIKRASEAKNSDIHKHDKLKAIIDCKLSKPDEKSLPHNFSSDSYEVEIKSVDLGTGSRSVSDDNCCEVNPFVAEQCAQDIGANPKTDCFYNKDYNSSRNHVEESINTHAKNGKNLLLPNIFKEKHLSADRRCSKNSMSKKTNNEVTRIINKNYLSENRKIAFTRGNKFSATHLPDSKILSSLSDNIKDTKHSIILKNANKSVKSKNNINNLKDKSSETVTINKTETTDKEGSITTSSDQIKKNYCFWENMSKNSIISKNENDELNKIKLFGINKLPLASEKNIITLKETTDGGSFKLKRNNISVEMIPSKTYSNEISDIINKEDIINYIKKGSAPYRKEVLRLPK